VIAVELDTPQASIGTTAVEIDLTRIPVDVLDTFLLVEVDRKDTAMAVALLGAPNNGCRYQLG
jgi:hypothetical protein